MDRKRIEGLLTIDDLFSKSDKEIFTFTEHYNSLIKRSVITISPFATEPTDYHYVDPINGLLSSKELGDCSLLELKQGSSLVPELNEFANKFAPTLSISQLLSAAKIPHAVGPIGFAMALMYHVNLDPKKVKRSNIEQERRNIPCNVEQIKFSLNADYDIEIAIYRPKNAQFRDSDGSIVAIDLIKIVTRDLAPTLKFEIDLTDINNDIDVVDVVRRESTFNLPFASGCSRFFANTNDFEHITKKGENSNLQMSLLYTQLSTDGATMIAVDAKRGYMRRHKLGHSVSIWDLNSNLLFHTAEKISSSDYEIKSSEQGTLLGIDKCKVLSLTDDKLSPFFKPYGNQSAEEELNPLQLLIGSPRDSLYNSGLRLNFASIGQGFVRDLPCHIYETVTRQPPRIFALNLHKDQKNDDTRSYITTFYLFEDIATSNASAGGWWPARVSIHEKIGSTTTLLDMLDIYEFSWSLLGWDKRPAEMFSASECFREATLDRRSVELLLQTETTNSDETAIALAQSKYQLELSIQKSISDTLQINVQHITDFKVNFRGASHIVARFNIANKPIASALKFVGRGKLTKEEHGLIVEVENIYDEGSCVLAGGLVENAVLAVYCPNSLTVKDPKMPCNVLVDNPSYGIEDDSNNGCLIYSFDDSTIDNKDKADTSQESAVGALLSKAKNLLDQTIEFNKVKAKVVDFEIQAQVNLKKIIGYTFEIDSGIKQIKRSIQSAASCAALCNLDVECKSYSFCPSDSDKESYECSLANVDIGGKIDIKEFNQTDIRLDTNGKEYRLRSSSKCSINERDYLTLYKVTNEFVKLSRTVTEKQNYLDTSAFECARKAALVEQLDPTRHIAMFASCVRSGACILDESLIEKSDNSLVGEDLELCVIHRKKYQTFFHPSLEIFPQGERSEKYSQTELRLSSVEECARVCWMKMGDKCASFDHCATSETNNCVINSIGAQNAKDAGIQLITRNECYHYERDFELDKLQKELQIGRQQLYDEMNGGGGSRSRSSNDGYGTVFWVFVVVLAPVGFMLGLFTGKQMSERIIKIRRVSTQPQTNATTGSTLNVNNLTLDDLYCQQNIQMKEIGKVKTKRKNSLKQSLIGDDENEIC